MYARFANLVGCALLASAPLANAAPQQTTRFDLLCAGTENTKSIKIGEKTVPAATRYRVDLTNGTYCKDECKEVGTIKEVNGQQFIFMNVTIGPITMIETVDRFTGEWMGLGDLGEAGRNKTSGTCHKELFSGFPKAEF